MEYTRRILAIAALVVSFATHAGINKWTSIGPDGGQVAKLVEGSGGTLYTLAGSGFWRSTDGGTHWSQNDDGIAPFVQDFAVEPVRPDRVYAVISRLPSRVLVSTNAGATFATLHTFEWTFGTPTRIAVSADGKTLYCIDSKRVARSTDGGQTWEQRPDLPVTALFGRDMVVDPTDANTVYLSYDGGLLVTHDGAGSWTNITPPNTVFVRAFAVDPTNTRRLWVGGESGLSGSTDGGLSWSLVRNGFTYAVAVDPRSPSTVYIGEFGGPILKGNGSTWTDITGNLGSLGPNIIMASPQDSSRLRVANGRGLWLTTDAGGHWTRTDSGLQAALISGFAVSAVRGRTYVKGVLGSLDDGSDSVTPLNDEALFAALNAKNSYITALAPVSDSGGGLIAAIANRIARSIDDGHTWSALPYLANGNDSVIDLAGATTFPATYYASSVQTLQRSVDLGNTWTSITAGLPAGYSGGVLAIAPSNSAILYAGPRDSTAYETGVGVYKSTNGGDSWTPANSGIEHSFVSALAVHPTQPNVVYAGTGAGLMKSVDGGATWTSLQWWKNSGPGQCTGIAIDPANPNLVYAVGGGYFDADVARSTDGGATWAHLLPRDEVVGWRPTSVAIDPARLDTVRVGTRAAGIQQMSLRPDLAIEASPLLPELTVGVPAAYTATVQNLGHLRATGVGVSIQLPTGSTDVTASANIGDCTVSGATVTCTASALNGDDTLTVKGAITPTVAGAFQLSGAVHADQSDIDASNDTAMQSSSVVRRSNLGVRLSGPDGPRPGPSLQFFATLTNTGPSPASGVRLTYHVPSGLTISTFTISAGACSKTSGDTLTCDLASLSTSDNVVLNVTTSAATAGTYVVTAAVTGDGRDDFADNDKASVSSVVEASPNAGGGNPGAGNGGGGGGAISPLLLLGLLSFAARSVISRHARVSAGCV